MGFGNGQTSIGNLFAISPPPQTTLSSPFWGTSIIQLELQAAATRLPLPLLLLLLLQLFHFPHAPSTLPFSLLQFAFAQLYALIIAHPRGTPLAAEQ